ncbi:AIPR family protein [Devosia sp.]|uniref:AIPR family protein n=1 Tax=Devosia sp. TaxID=1871048 RepID=UPI002732873F|nr:AIPR family protein [Devosia sp.]MDP2782876.1 AIPR family protein [Devosia sp.]
MAAERTIEIPPKASALINSLRGLGYSPETAIADLIDNSITAGAVTVEIDLQWNDGRPVAAIFDNGRGMGEKRLAEAMQLGGDGPDADRSENDLGRFGMGLKTASLSQSSRLTAVSRAEDTTTGITMDVEVIAARGWIATVPDPLPKHPFVSKLLTLSAGTVVLWENIDELSGLSGLVKEAFYLRLEEIRAHLGMVFHRFINGDADRLAIVLNGRPVKAWDPFQTQHPATIAMPVERIRHAGSSFSVKPYVLPHRDRFANDTEYEAAGGPGGWGARQGFYVYRGKRLLVAGSWLGLGGSRTWTRDEASRLSRIQVDLPTGMDRDWRIDVRKSQARPPGTLRGRLTAIAGHCRKEAREVFAFRGQTTASLHRARRKDSLNLEHVSVPVKIIKVGGADLSEMVSSISRAANRQNTVQLADFSANDPFHQQIETLANTTWLDDAKGRWFYERARGSYLAAEQKAAFKVSDTKTFRQQTPKQRRLSKLDVARYLSAWESLPDKVCLGGQKNFQIFMQRLKDAPVPEPDQNWFKRLIAISVLYRAAEKKIKSMKFPAYGSQITAYVVAGFSHRSGGRVDFDRLWSKQAVSLELEQLIADWAPKLDAVMRESAGQRNPSEWYKKAECWKDIQDKLPELSDPLPPELSYETASSSTGISGPMIPKGTHTVADYDRIARCMEIPAAIWLEVAERGQQTSTIHWTVAGICRTIAGYAAGGWQRKPTAKQAKPALEAVIAVERAGLVKAGLITQEAKADQA